MIEINTIGVWGFEGAIRGMRNPYESHKKSDSVDCRGCEFFDVDKYSCTQHGMTCPWGHYLIGESDMTLCKKLIKGGSEHRKFLRMIHVQADVVAPRYWWAEMDKYKYVEANSSSTMHLITKRTLSLDDFSYEEENRENMKCIVTILNTFIAGYQTYTKRPDAEKKKRETDAMFKMIKQMLPESYNQLRTIDTNYEALLNIYRQRKSHRLTEWREFCEWIESLPYMEEFLNEI